MEKLIRRYKTFYSPAEFCNDVMDEQTEETMDMLSMSCLGGTARDWLDIEATVFLCMGMKILVFTPCC